LINNILKWSALVITLSGAICTSMKLDPMNVYLLNLGCVVYLSWSWRIREWSLVLVNAGLLAIYLPGGVMRLLGQM